MDIRMVDFSLYNARQTAYKEQLQSYEIGSMQDQISYQFTENPSYELIVYNDEERHVHVVDIQKNYNRPVGIKKVLGYPNDKYKLGDYITLWGDTWLITGQDEDSKVQAKFTVQRCNHVLKFYNNGILYKMESVLNRGGYYDLKKDTMVMLPDNQQRALVRYDDVSKMVKWADVNNSENKYTRFIIEGEAFRVTSLDKLTGIVKGVGYMDMRIQADQIKPTDDLENDIADANQIVTLEILNGNSITIGSGQSIQINSTVDVNGEKVSNPKLKYTSQNTTLATVSETGLINCISDGNVNITVSYGEVSQTIALIISSVVENNYTIEIKSTTPNIEQIKLGQTVTYNAKSLNNGEEYVTTRTFELFEDDGVTILPSTVISVVGVTNDYIKCKADTSSKFVNKWFRLRVSDGNVVEEIRIQIKALF